MRRFGLPVAVRTVVDVLADVARATPTTIFADDSG